MRTTITTLRALSIVGAVLEIRSMTKMLEISRGVDNRMVVRYIQTIDSTAAYSLFASVKENETSRTNY